MSEIAQDPRDNIPSPPALPLLGNLLDVQDEVPIRALERFADTSGEIFKVSVAGWERLFVASMSLLDELCDETRFWKAPGDSRNLRGSWCQRDPKVYGEDAEDFKPESMLGDAFNKLPKSAWKPFGNGKFESPKMGRRRVAVKLDHKGSSIWASHGVC